MLLHDFYSSCYSWEQCFLKFVRNYVEVHFTDSILGPNRARHIANLLSAIQLSPAVCVCVQVKRVMNGVFHSLRGEFDLSESYTGQDVLGVIVSTIKVSGLYTEMLRQLLYDIVRKENHIWRFDMQMDKIMETLCFVSKSYTDIFNGGR